jgi:hypothetical protein
LALFVIAFVLWPERGCVGDQPQHVRLFHGFRICHALRLTLRAQSRSANDAAPMVLWNAVARHRFVRRDMSRRNKARTCSRTPKAQGGLIAPKSDEGGWIEQPKNFSTQF